MKKIGILLAIFVSAYACGQKAKTNKEKAVELIHSLETGEGGPVAYINPQKYIQHNLMAADGLAGFGELMKHKPPGGFKAKVIRAIQDGDYVVTHSEYDFFGPKIGFDIFRFENGQIVEHWDNLQETVAVGKSGHSMTDGTSQSVDPEKTNANKQLVQGFYADVLMGGDLSKINSYVAEPYTQHNPMASDGVESFSSFMKMAKEKHFFKIEKTHLVLGEGNLVLVQSEGSMMGKPAAFYDLFRVQDGKIVEHWDVIEPTLPKEKWKNSNGKF